jgi:hypothetical protein
MTKTLAVLSLILFTAVRAAAQAPPDESARVGELTIDATAGFVVNVPATATARSLGARDNTAEANATSVDAATGTFLSPPGNVASALGAVDHSGDVAALSIDATNGLVLASPGSSSDFDAIDHSADVAQASVNAATGTFNASPPSSTQEAAQGAVDLSFLVNALSVNPTTGAILSSPPAFAFAPGPAGPALPYLAACALIGLIAVRIAFARVRSR